MEDAVEQASYRVYRGGGWNITASRLRASYRNWLDPSYRSDNLGFRLARPYPWPLNP